MSTFRILVTGSRSWDREDVIRASLDIVAREALAAGFLRIVLIHGACPTGADAHADKWYRAKRGEMPLGVERYPANWKQHPRGAGFLRNRRMVKTGADVCLAFVRDASAGATHCALAAERAGITVQLLDYDALPERAS